MSEAPGNATAVKLSTSPPYLLWLQEAEPLTPVAPGDVTVTYVKAAPHLLWLHHARAAHDSLAALQLPKQGPRPDPQIPGSLRQELAGDVLETADVAGSGGCLQTMYAFWHVLAMGR